MSLPHRKAYATAEKAMASKAYLASPGATLDLGCPCGMVHVDLPKPPPKMVQALKPRRDTGPDAKTRKLVLERDGYACVCCGLSVIGQRYSLAHRKRASQGGKAVPENLITLLGWGAEAHHGRVDLYKDPADGVKGYRLQSGQDPLTVPVAYATPDGGYAEFWLRPDGSRSGEPPEEVSAA